MNWIDTAAVYGLGHSEEVVARALQEWHGPRPYIFTKCGMIWNGQGKVNYSLRQESVRRECEASLRRLKTDVIDLYQIHRAVGDRHGRSPGETPIAWTVTGAIVGARNPKQVDGIIGAMDFRLTELEIEKLGEDQ